MSLFREGIAARCSARAVGAHVCGLRGVFSDAHVVRKNDLTLFAACGRQNLRSCRGMGRRRRLLPARGTRHPQGSKAADGCSGCRARRQEKPLWGVCVPKNASRSAVHRRGVTIPTPVRRVDRAASSKPVRFIRRWRRFTGFRARLWRALRQSETPAKGGLWPDFCVVHKLFTLRPIDNGKCRWYTAFSTQGKGVLKLRKERGVWT